MNEVEKKVKIGLWRQRIGYGSSDFACNLIWQMISLYLLYFYTNVMHLNAGAVSVMFLVTKVIDGISDLIVGFLIDKTNTRWGKSRPWILFGAVPFGVAAVVAFSVPNIGQTGMLIYAYVSYILLSTAYTVVNIPMASILPALSEDPHERTVLASCRTFFSSVGSTVVSAFALTLVDKFGNGNEALGFRIVMMIFGVIGCLVFFFCFFNTKERVVIKQEKVSLKANISCLLHNKPWKLFALNIVWFFGGYVIQASAVIYYFTYVVQNTTLVQIVATITTLVPIVANLCAPFLVKLTSKRNLMVGRSFVHMGGLLIIFFGGTNVPVLLAGAVLPEEGAEILDKVIRLHPEKGMVSPYMNHHFVEALLICGRKEQALEYMKYYWGGMLKHGAVHRHIFYANIFNLKYHFYTLNQEADYGKVNSRNRINAGCRQI